MSIYEQIQAIIKQELEEAQALSDMYLALVQNQPECEKSYLYQLGRSNELRQLLRMFEALQAKEKNSVEHK